MTTKQVRFRKGTTAEHANFVGAIAEVTVDTTKNTLRVHDNTTTGGHVIATEAFVNGVFDGVVDLINAGGGGGGVGPQGPQGPAGPAGPQGPTGAQGPKGDTGNAGAQGLKGDKGDTGAKGDKGDTGEQGVPGATGAQGPAGSTGPMGPQGPIGATGPHGATGPIGPQGVQGPQGPTGPEGVSVTLQGTKATIADLPAAPTNVNDYAGHGWIVTTGDGEAHLDGALWFWNLEEGAWNDIGKIVGPVGPQGIQGPAGATGPAGTTDPFDRIVNGDLAVILNNQGTLTTPLLLPVTFTAVLDSEHMVQGVGLTDTPWDYTVAFQVGPNGTVQTMIDNSPWPSNPGYVTGYQFEYTEADHGIPDYTFTITLTDIQHPNEFVWTGNIAVSPPPEFPSTVKSLGAVKLTADGNHLVLGTDGIVTAYAYKTFGQQTVFANSDDVGIRIDSANTPTSIDIGSLSEWDFARLKLGAGTVTGNAGDIELQLNPMETAGSFSISPNGGRNGSFVFGHDGVLTVPDAIKSGLTDQVGFLLTTNAPNSIQYQTADFSTNQFTGGSFNDIQVGWYVMAQPGDQFLGTVTGLNSPTPGCVTKNGVAWPMGGDVTYYFQSPDYAPAGQDAPVVLRSGTSNYTFNDEGSLVTPHGSISHDEFGNFVLSSYPDKNVRIWTGGMYSWDFKTDAKLQLPQGGDIVDYQGNSVLGGGGGGNPFDQDLNTTNDVTFNKVTLGSTVVTNNEIKSTEELGGQVNIVTASTAGDLNKTWKFSHDGAGALVLADGSNIRAKYGLSIQATEPEFVNYTNLLDFDTNSYLDFANINIVNPQTSILDVIDPSSPNNSVGPGTKVRFVYEGGMVAVANLVTGFVSNGFEDVTGLPQWTATIPTIDISRTLIKEISFEHSNNWRFAPDGTLTAPGDINTDGTITATDSVVAKGVTITNNDELRFDTNGSSITEQRPGEGYDFFATDTVAITGAGVGAKLNVYYSAGDTAYQVNVNDGGTYTYNLGDQLKITGDALGGVTPDNDLIVEVTATYFDQYPGALFNVSVVSGTPPGYLDGLHVRVNGTEWTFGTDQTLKMPGGIKFGDGTIQSTAATGGGGAGDRLVNGSKEIVLQSDGSLTLPIKSVIDNNGNLLTAPTLSLGVNNNTTVITQAENNDTNRGGYPIRIQGQRGYGNWSTEGPGGWGGPIEIRGGMGGETSDDLSVTQGGEGGYVEVIGGDGQAGRNAGYVAVRAGNAKFSGNYPNNVYGGSVWVQAGHATDSNNADHGFGGNVFIDAGQGNHAAGHGYIQLNVPDGGQWRFNTNGSVEKNGSFTRTTNIGIQNIDVSGVVWEAAYDYVSSVKLVIQVETQQVGDVTGWHSQVCEAIIASRGYAGGTNGFGEPVMTVYGVTYTSTQPLVTFTVQRNALTRKIEVVATRTAATVDGISLRTHSVEMTTLD